MNRAFHRSAGPAQGASCAATELARWQCYMEALDCAGQAMDRARKLVPDHGLDHGVERIRSLLIAAVAELDRLQAEAQASAAGDTQDQAGAGVCPDQ